MRKLHASALVTLDGVWQDPGGFGETAQGGWANRYFNDEAVADSMEQLAGAGTFLLGRTTYELLSKAWSGATGDYMEMLHALPKLVASTTLRGPLDWNATVLGGDVVEEIAQLKRGPGKDIVMYGSGSLARVLLRHGLIDTFKVSIFPLVLGTGSRLFPEGFERTELQLVDVKTLRSGVTTLTYQSGTSRS